jgi:hypothetical protein
MNEYNHAANQLKDSIIDEFLSKNPGVKRAEVVTKLVNGRVVVGTIQDIFKKMSDRSQQKTMSPAHQKLLKELATGGDERYARCLKSVHSSKSYISWLVMYKFSGFTDADQKENLSVLQQQDSSCSEKAIQLHEVKGKFVTAMKNAIKPTRSLIQTTMLEYFSAVRDQLNCQKVILKKEVDLGNKFGVCTTGLIQDNFSTLRSVKNPKAIRAVERAIQILKENAIQVPVIQKDADIKLITKSIDELDKKLEERRLEFNDLNMLVKFLETIINELQPPKKEDSSKEAPSTRMAFASKKKGR